MLEGAYTTVQSLFTDYPVETALSSLSVAAVVSLIWGVREIILSKDKKYMHEYVPRIRTKTLTKHREAFVDDIFANKIKYVGEKLVQDMICTREEVNIRYRRLNKGFRNKNFIPSVFRLKAELKAKKAAKTLHPATVKKITLPNGTVVRETNVVKGSFGDKSRRRSIPKSA